MQVKFTNEYDEKTLISVPYDERTSNSQFIEKARKMIQAKASVPEEDLDLIEIRARNVVPEDDTPGSFAQGFKPCSYLAANMQ